MTFEPSAIASRPSRWTERPLSAEGVSAPRDARIVCRRVALCVESCVRSGMQARRGSTRTTLEAALLPIPTTKLLSYGSPHAGTAHSALVSSVNRGSSEFGRKTGVVSGTVVLPPESGGHSAAKVPMEGPCDSWTCARLSGRLR